MNIVLKTLRKPLVWKPIVVLSVIAINLALGSGRFDIGFWTVFSIILSLSIGSNFGLPKNKTQNRRETYKSYCKRQQTRYGYGDVRTYSDRKNRFGY